MRTLLRIPVLGKLFCMVYGEHLFDVSEMFESGEEFDSFCKNHSSMNYACDRCGRRSTLNLSSFRQVQA